MSVLAGDAPPPSRGLAVASLVVGLLSVLTLGGLCIGPLLGLVLGIVALVRSVRRPAEFGGRGTAWAGIVASVLSVLVGAIVIPSLLRIAVEPPESAPIGDTRTIISAQQAYSSVNGGYYDGRLECLAGPSQCIPGYTGPAFLDESLASLRPKSGYRRELHAGPQLGAAGESEAGGKVSPSSVRAYAYVSFPDVPGKAGARAFCGDASGIVCSTSDGRTPAVKDGACDLGTCQLLR
jgi:hypothetical protein